MIARIVHLGSAMWLLSVTVLAQVEKRQTFEVAAIKTHLPGSGPGSISRSGAGITIIGYTPRMLIKWAYDVRDDHLIGQSKWLDAVRYDIVAQAGEPTSTQRSQPGPFQQMMQSLLQERFGLVVHHETRVLPFYALLIDTGGPKIKLSDAEEDVGKGTFSMNQPGRLAGTKVTMPMLANVLSNQIERSVQDLTGLKGSFDFMLNWSPDSLLGTEADNTLPSFFAALREQLGVKLESRRGPVDVIIVDQLASDPGDN